MILLLDTSTSVCRLSLIDGQDRYDSEWEANRDLARGLLEYLEQQLTLRGGGLHSITGIGVFQGPGSFTGLRIGMTVLNTIADSEQVPIVGTVGEDWQAEAPELLKSGVDHKIVLPHYGSDATITKPRK